MAFLSFVQQRAMHPAYQRIIGMGWVAVPYILQELARRPDHWEWALQSITGEEPARDAQHFQAAVEASCSWAWSATARRRSATRRSGAQEVACRLARRH